MEENETDDTEDEDIVAVLLVLFFIFILLLPFILFLHPNIGIEMFLLLAWIIIMFMEPAIVLTPAQMRFLFCGIINNFKKM